MCSPFSTVTWPDTIVARIPIERCSMRWAPVGRSSTILGIEGAILAGSSTFRSAMKPSHRSPRPRRPQARAGANVISRVMGLILTAVATTGVLEGIDAHFGL